MEFRVETDALRKPLSIYDPPPEYQEYIPGLRSYNIDDVPVTEAEFNRRLQEARDTSPNLR